MKFLKHSVPVYYLLLTLLLSATAMAWMYLRPVKIVEKVSSQNNCNIDIIRQQDYELTKPLLLVDMLNEEQSFIGLKSSISNYFDQQKATGSINSASVYFRQQEDGKWFCINPGEVYSPGSIMKIVTLICYLKESETNPSILEKKILLSRHFGEIPLQTLVSQPLHPGTYYSVRELLSAMIINSDNDATALLNAQVDFDIYKNVLKNIGLPIPQKTQANYEFNIVECSRLIRVLYNASVLEPANSEYALKLLTQSNFREGLVKFIDPNLKVAHKFGERNFGDLQQLHETGVFYFRGRPYLLTVMTKGPDHTKLPAVLADVSKLVYDYINSGGTASLN